MTWNYPPIVGGIEYLIHHLHEGLARRGHDVVLLTAHHPAAASGVGASGPVWRASRPGLPSFLCFALMRGWREIRRRRPDVILAGSLVAGPVVWLLSRIFRIPYVLPVYGSDLVVPHAAYQGMARRVVRSALRVFPISEHTRRLLLEKGVDERRSVIVHPGVDVDAALAEPPADVLARWRQRTQGRRVVLAVGRLIRRKGVLELVRHVMPGLVRRHPDILLLVAGEDAGSSLIHKEKMSDAIRAEIARQHLDAHVQLLGRVADDDLQSLYRCADLFVMPCLDLPNDIEGFGIVLLEAGLLEVPSVATRVGGIPDAVEDGRTGCLVPAGDHEAFGAAVTSLLQDDARRRRMGAAAAERARRAFAWDVIVAHYDRALRDALPDITPAS